MYDTPLHGTLAMTPDGSFVYTPEAGYLGPDDFSYTATDPFGGTDQAWVHIEVYPNSPPNAYNAEYTMLTTDPSLAVAAPGFLSMVVDPEGDPFAAVLVTTTGHGSLTFGVDGSFTYVPDAGFVGDDSFTFYASDGWAESDTKTVTIHVTSPDAPPVGVADSYNARKNNVLHVGAPGVLANDSDPDGDAMTAVKVSGPSHGTLVFNADGSFAYTPRRGFVGADSFTYKVVANGVETGPVAVSLTVLVPKK